MQNKPEICILPEKLSRFYFIDGWILKLDFETTVEST